MPKPKTPKPDTFRNRIVGHADVDPKTIRANEKNWRTHPPMQRQAMKGALQELGFIQQVVINKRSNRLVDGHLRVELALEHKQRTVPVTLVDLSPSEEKLALASFDPLGALADTDRDRLGALLGTLDRTNDDMKGLLDRLAKQAKGLQEEVKAGQTDPDAIPGVPPGRRRTQVGDLWTLGEHRLVVGDATDRALVEAVAAPSGLVDCLWTDPPYSVNYEGSAGTIENDNLSDPAFAAFLDALFREAAAVLKPGGGVYVAHGDSQRPAFQKAMVDAGLLVKQCLIWVKHAAVLSRQDYNWRHEPILAGWKAGAAHYFAFDFTETTVTDDSQDLKALSRKQLEELVVALRPLNASTAQYHDRPMKSELHPTTKPVALVEQHLRNSTRRGERVLDPCAGSGTTLIACERLGRKACLIELDPRFGDVILKRWEDFTGQQAERVSRG